MTPQQKIGSGFGAESTTIDVIQGIDLTGKLAVVTGGSSGLGLATTRALAGAGAQVVVAARRPELAREAVAGIDGVEVDELDLGDQASVRAFAERFLESGRSIDILVNNAGIMASPEKRLGPGWESQFATNHLGHFALVNLLWPALVTGDGARVVAVSSRGHNRSPIRWDDVQFERDYDKWVAYGQSKTANILFAVHLDTLGRDSGVRAFALHPGVIATGLDRHLSTEELVTLGLMDENRTASTTFAYKSVAQGAATQVWAATSPRLDGFGGVYLEDSDIAEVAAEGDATKGVRDYAIDPDQAARLWALSAELTGISAHLG